jgi:hypothetical protein
MVKILHTSCKFSFGHHPKTNGQSERTNQKLEKYLRCFVNNQQDDWADILHLAEFVYNNFEHSSTGYSQFFTNIRYRPRWIILKHLEFSTNPAVENRLTRLQEIQDIILQNLCDAQNTQKNVVHYHRRDSSSKFHVGDQVCLLHGNYETLPETGLSTFRSICDIKKDQ